MKNLVADGTSLLVTAAAAIAAGQAMVVGDRVAVAVDAIANTEEGVALIQGVFQLPKTSADVIGQGDIIYYNAGLNEITSTAAGATKAGYAHAAAGAAVVLIDVVLSA